VSDVASARKKIIAGLIGVVLIGTPVGAFNYGLHKFIDRQGQEDVETAAQRAIALGEARIGAALSTLQQLNNQGIAACTSSQLDVLRRATVTANIVKDLSIVDVAGETVCSVLGIGQDEYKVIASQELFPDGEAFIDVLQVGGAKEPMIDSATPRRALPRSSRPT
jgi:sensor c-di-GMP phosphodiesterase-like protein